jgi:hypothetical protein
MSCRKLFGEFNIYPPAMEFILWLPSSVVKNLEEFHIIKIYTTETRDITSINIKNDYTI